MQQPELSCIYYVESTYIYWVIGIVFRLYQRAGAVENNMYTESSE